MFGRRRWKICFLQVIKKIIKYTKLFLTANKRNQAKANAIFSKSHPLKKKYSSNHLYHLQFCDIKKLQEGMETQLRVVYVVMPFQSAQNAKLTNAMLAEFFKGVAANVVITKQNVSRAARVHRQYKSIPMFHIQPHPSNGSRK